MSSSMRTYWKRPSLLSLSTHLFQIPEAYGKAQGSFSRRLFKSGSILHACSLAPKLSLDDAALAADEASLADRASEEVERERPEEDSRPETTGEGDLPRTDSDDNDWESDVV